jgi:hypothetical protein
MKEVKEERFTKKGEDMSFNPVPIPTNDRPNERTSVASQKPVDAPSPYTIRIPKVRRKTRQSFDIFEDQYEALKKLQVAEMELEGRGGKKLGTMVQEALDSFIHARAKKCGGIMIVGD